MASRSSQEKTLVQLSDYRTLLIEGQAFQRGRLSIAKRNQKIVSRCKLCWSVSDEDREIIDDLKIVYIDHEVGRETRALAFYVALENEIEREQTQKRSAFRQLAVQAGPTTNVAFYRPAPLTMFYVVPNEAVADEGPNQYVFVDRGEHFERVAVSVVARDSIHTAIANDGSLRPVSTCRHQPSTSVTDGNQKPKWWRSRPTRRS